MTSSNREDPRDRRTHLRIGTKIAARHRRASAAEIDAFQAHLRLRGPTAGSRIDPELVDHLARLERKLDHVLSFLAPDVEPPLLATEIREVELSGSGMGYDWHEPLAEGERVICDLLLPGIPPHGIRAVARSLHCGGAGDRYQIGFCFEVIDERDRDAIVRHVNREQVVGHNEPAHGGRDGGGSGGS